MIKRLELTITVSGNTEGDCMDQIYEQLGKIRNDVYIMERTEGKFEKLGDDEHNMEFQDISYEYKLTTDNRLWGPL